MKADNYSNVSSAADDGRHHCSIAGAMKLVTHPFGGDKKIKRI